MDKRFGLPSIDAPAFDLMVTDPPYGIKYKKPSGLGTNPKINWDTDTVLYDDQLTGDQYYAWCRLWMDQALRTCNNVVFTPGNPNLRWWLEQYNPYDVLVWIKRNTQSGGRSAWFQRHEYILVMRKTHPKKYSESFFDIPTHSGFMNDHKFIHPAPKTLKFWQVLIGKLTPASVVDPFLGSGTTAEVCEILGIPWVGFEIMEEFAPDIERRIARGIKKRKQQNLERFVNGDKKN